MNLQQEKVEKTVRIMKISEQGNDFNYWQNQSPELRLAALEQIRQEYHRWKYGTEPGFQRIYSVVKRK